MFKSKLIRVALLSMLILPTLLAILIPSGVAYGMTGSGTVGDPYVIYDVYDLQNMSLHLGAYYILGNNIDATVTNGWNAGAGFIPIGQGTPYFTGSFDGKNYTITNLYIHDTSSSAHAGLFANLQGSVKNVGLINVSINSNYMAGGLVGVSSGVINNSYSTGSIVGVLDIGGLVGFASGTINNSYSTASVHGGSYVGGLVGVSSGVIKNSYSTGSIVGGYAGGLIGVNIGGAPVSCY